MRENGQIDGWINLDLIISSLEKIRQYLELGTAEELREAIEKQRAKKPVYVEGELTEMIYKCPNCGADYNRFYRGKPHCMFCGQAIDWRGE